MKLSHRVCLDWQTLQENYWVPLLLVVLLFAAFLRLYRLDSWPPIHIDEAIGGQQALRVLSGDIDLLEPSFTHYLAVAHLPLSLLFELSGPSLAALRGLAVMYGLGAVLATFWAGSVFFGRTAGIYAALIQATSHLAIAMVRVGGVNSQAIFLAVLCFAAYGQALKSGGGWWVVWGAVTGLGVYTYEGFRILPLVIVLGILLGPRLLWQMRRGVALAFLVFIAVASPMLFRLVVSPDEFLSEPQRQTVLGNPDGFLEAYQTDSVLAVIREQFKISFRYFIDGGNRDTQYGFRGPGFDWLTKSLFFAGVLVALVRIRDLGYRTVLLWFWLGLLLGSAMTESPPLAPRLAMLMPAAALLAGGALGQAVDALPFRGRPIAGILTAAAVSVVLLASNYSNYFEKYDQGDIYWPWVEPNRSIGLYVSELDASTPVYLFRTPGVWADNSVLDFLRKTGRGSDAKVADIQGWEKPDFDLSRSLGKEQTGEVQLIFTEESTDLAASFQSHCESSRQRTMYGPPDGKPIFLVVTIPDHGCLSATGFD